MISSCPWSSRPTQEVGLWYRALLVSWVMDHRSPHSASVPAGAWMERGVQPWAQLVNTSCLQSASKSRACGGNGFCFPVVGFKKKPSSDFKYFFLPFFTGDRKQLFHVSRNTNYDWQDIRVQKNSFWKISWRSKWGRLKVRTCIYPSKPFESHTAAFRILFVFSSQNWIDLQFK